MNQTCDTCSLRRDYWEVLALQGYVVTSTIST